MSITPIMVRFEDRTGGIRVRVVAGSRGQVVLQVWQSRRREDDSLVWDPYEHGCGRGGQAEVARFLLRLLPERYWTEKGRACIEALRRGLL